MERATASPENIKNPTILIVDDQIDNIQVLTLFLETQGYSVTYALSAKDTLQRLNAIQPDLILLDLFMPDINGLELCKQIKEKPTCHDIPVIFLTASHDERHVITAFEQGAADYMTKPFNAKEVLARAKTHIKLRQKTIELQQAKEQLNIIVTHVQDGLIVIDKTGVIQFVNPAAAQMFKQPVDLLLGEDIGQPLVERHLTQIEILRLNGEVGIAEITVAQTTWNNQPASIICLRDISDRQATEET
ncbi:response regulator [Vacuolonema iberomarrocanum]|uniref:response regulator n=1 Tax=Vacuolonema iberomarrocanum TaxID=3454632 RepID=UPI001A032EC9|nr:response regulator [filamentous cyanobacterium LEGE 07170]